MHTDLAVRTFSHASGEYLLLSVTYLQDKVVDDDIGRMSEDSSSDDD